MAAKERIGNLSLLVQVAAGEILQEGELAVINEEGYALPAKKETNLTSIGIVKFGEDNRLGEAGAISVQVKRGAWKMKNDGTIKPTDLLKTAYIKDAYTISITADGSSAVGKILQVEEDGVTVEIL